MSSVDAVFGRGFRSLLQREILRVVRRPRDTVLPPAITNALYFAVFGVVLGAVANAVGNSSFSVFHGRWNEYLPHQNVNTSYGRWLA